MTIQKECEKLKDKVINTQNQSCCLSSSITKYSFEQESLPEFINKNIDSCKIQQLLCEIEECCSKEPSDKTNELMEQLKTLICSLTKEIESSSLKYNQENFKCCVEKPNIVLDENQRIKRELSEKCQIIEAGIIIKQELETKLSNLEIKFGKLEKLNNSCNKKCNDLIIQNTNLENDLKDEKKCSSKKAIYIDDLSKQINILETIIKGIEDHKILYTEEISKLKNDKSVSELKLNELNSIINTQKKELVINRSKLAHAEESLKNKNDCQIQQIQQLEQDKKQFEKETQFYKDQYDLFKNKCLLSDKDLSESRNTIKSLEIKINEIMIERNMIFDDLSKECNYLKSENSNFLENINELNKSIICINRERNYLLNDLATCNEKLLIANDEISNFYFETKSLNTKLEKVTDKLTCIERELEETKLKLNQETYLKEKINEKYCSIKYECTCLQEKCQTADNHRLLVS